MLQKGSTREPLFYIRKRNPQALPVNLKPMISRATATKAAVFFCNNHKVRRAVGNGKIQRSSCF
jgi:hypothetical protein